MSKVNKQSGSFRKTPSNKWEYRIAYKNDCNVKRYKSFTADTQEECLQRASAFRDKLAKHMMGIDVDASIPDLLLRKIKEDFDNGFTGEQGYDRNLHTVEIIRLSFLGSIPIIDITEEQLIYFLQILSKKYSNNTLSKVYGMLRAAYKLAVYHHIIQTNLMDSNAIRCPKSKLKDKDVKGLTEDEYKRLLTALDTHKVPKNRNNYKLQLLIELYAGLRMGEINALKPGDIHLKEDSGYIHVHATVARGMNCRPFVKDGTKTDAGVRDVPISKLLVPVLQEALKNYKRNPEGLLFYDRQKGSIIETHQVNSFFRRICEKAGIEFRGQHCLRHTFATRAIESGISPLVLKTWLGHTDIHITLDTYSDVYDRMNQSAVNQLNSYMDMISDEKH